MFQKFVSKVKTNNAQITDKKIIEEGLKLHYDADLFFLSTNFVSPLHYNMVSLIFKKTYAMTSAEVLQFSINSSCSDSMYYFFNKRGLK